VTLLAGVLLSCQAAWAAVEASGVLVLYNSASLDGQQIANHYAQVHPGVHLLGLEGVTSSEEVTADYYLSTIRPQVLEYLNAAGAPQIDVLVTTKGLPLRIENTHANPGSYPGWRGELFGIEISDDWWEPYSSLESELTRIETVSTWEQMGDQAFFMSPPGFPFPTDHHASNPYYGQKTAFSPEGFEGMRLTARLDGYTAADVISAIDRAQDVFVVPFGQYVVVDDDPNAAGGDADRMTPLVNDVLAPRNQAYVHDTTDAAVTTAPGPVIGYVSHGVNDGPGGLSEGYLGDQLALELAEGAVFQSYESYNAYSFEAGGGILGQGLLAEWLAIGGTAGVGHVEEPTASTCTIANEDIFFEMLLDGYTWAEAAWCSLQQLSFVNTVVGDPLMTFQPWLPGDFNLDGSINTTDLGILAENFGSFGGTYSMGDANGDGLVNVTDLGVLSSNFSETEGGHGVPEPATLGLLGLGAVAALRKKNRR